MQEFEFSLPQKVVVGKDSLKKLPDIIKELKSKKTFIISGPHVYKMGSVDIVKEMCEKEEIKTYIYAETEADPSVETVNKVTKLFLKSGADSIIVYGGGSPMDVAKVVAVLARQGGEVRDYEGAHKVKKDVVPVVAIPTTAGTGSKTTPFSVITDHERNYKLTVFSYEIIPRVAILDASLICSLPKSIAAATSIDALVYAIESYISKAATPFSEMMSQKAMELIGRSMLAFIDDRNNLEAAQDMILGSMFAGVGFSWARLGNVHAMSHPVTAYFNTSHGLANAIILPVVIDYNEKAVDSKKYKEIYNYLSFEKIKKYEKGMLSNLIKRIYNKLEIPEKLSDIGVTEDKILDMTKDAMTSGNIIVNPRETGFDDIK